jgi:hypothetical protein
MIQGTGAAGSSPSSTPEFCSGSRCGRPNAALRFRRVGRCVNLPALAAASCTRTKLAMSRRNSPARLGCGPRADVVKAAAAVEAHGRLHPHIGVEAHFVQAELSGARLGEGEQHPILANPRRCAEAGRKRSCSTNNLKRDDDSKKSHHALGRQRHGQLDVTRSRILPASGG